MSERPLLQHVCAVCDRPFRAPAKHRGRHLRFCSDDCRKARIAAQNRSYRAEGRRHFTNRTKIAKVCVVCDQPFETTNRRTKCCGVDCGQRLAGSIAGAASKARARPRPTRACAHCQATFEIRNPSGKARAGLVREGLYCSRRCTVMGRRTDDLFAKAGLLCP